LALRYRHHLFDTLYDAVALNTPGAELVTAHERYYNKTRLEGQISLLADFKFP
jgi:predicted nucleic acid-binding protein